MSEVFIFCFGCYGRAQTQYLSWLVHQTAVRAFNRDLFLMKDIPCFLQHI